MQFSVLPLQVDVIKSQGSPVSMQCGPFKLGETSPRFVDAKAATNSPYYKIVYMVNKRLKYLLTPLQKKNIRSTLTTN